MQAELTTLKGQFQLAPNLKKAAGAKDDDKEEGKKERWRRYKKKKNKKNNANKKEQKKDENWKKTPPKEREKVKGHTWRWCKHHMAWSNQIEITSRAKSSP
jgi:hypothetical protein